MINLTEPQAQLLVSLLTDFKPLENGVENYQALYELYGNDTAAYARALRNLHQTGSEIVTGIGQVAEETRQKYRSIQTPDYTQLKWFTTDPDQAIYTHPDRLTGAFFEEVLPFLLTAKEIKGIMGKSRMGAKSQLLLSGTWVAHTSLLKAYVATKRHYQLHREELQKDPEYQKYCRESQGPEEECLQAYIEAKARRSGLEAALLGTATFLLLHQFNQVTTTEAESQALTWLKKAVNSVASTIAKESVKAAKEANSAKEGKIP